MSDDNRWPVYEPKESAPEQEPLPTTSPTSRPPRRGALAAVAVLVVLGAGGAVLVDQAGGDSDADAPSAIDDGDGDGDAGDLEPADDPADPVDVEPDVLSVAGFQDLVAALRQDTGSSEVFDASLYDAFAYLRVPVDRTSQRETRYDWDGDLENTGPKGTSDQERIDLADIDPEVLLGLLRRVTRLVEAPATTYVLINGRPTDPFFDDGVRIMAYATNEYSETAYLAARVDGSLVRRYVSTEE